MFHFSEAWHYKFYSGAAFSPIASEQHPCHRAILKCIHDRLCKLLHHTHTLDSVSWPTLILTSCAHTHLCE